MLDRTETPYAHRVGLFHDVGPLVNDTVVHIAVGTKRTFGLPVLFAVGRKHRIQLDDYLGQCH